MVASPVVSTGCTVVSCAAGHLVSSRVIDSGKVVADASVSASATVVAQAPDTTATIVVSVPADAKVTIDGQPTVSTSTTRYFQTPSLQNGKTYAYTIEAQYVKDGATRTVNKKIDFKAGDLVRCDLTSATAVVRK